VRAVLLKMIQRAGYLCDGLANQKKVSAHFNPAFANHLHLGMGTASGVMANLSIESS
jgi:hypothetical protein